jgi:hypothetical protein
MEENNKTITIKFRLEKEDAGEYSAAVMKSKMRLSKRQLMLLAATVIIIAVSLLYTFITGGGATNLSAAEQPAEKFSVWPVIILFLLVLYRISSPFITKTIAKRQFEKNELLQKETEYTFSPEGIKVQSEVTSVDRRWENVYKVIETKKYIAILESNESASVIPKHCFSSDEELQAVTKLMKDKLPEKKYETIEKL